MVEEGYDIVAPIPSCVLMFKQEIPLLFPEDPLVLKVKKAMYDPFEYLMLRHKAGALKTDFRNGLGKVSYHVPCHQRVQNIGLKTRDVLQLDAASQHAEQRGGFVRRQVGVHTAIGHDRRVLAGVQCEVRHNASDEVDVVARQHADVVAGVVGHPVGQLDLQVAGRALAGRPSAGRDASPCSLAGLCQNDGGARLERHAARERG